MPINYDYPCKRCDHNYEDHVEGYRCAICFVDCAYDAMSMCYRFVPDNLRYLQEKYENKA